jgi:hypothetical protein
MQINLRSKVIILVLPFLTGVSRSPFFVMDANCEQAICKVNIFSIFSQFKGLYFQAICPYIERSKKIETVRKYICFELILLTKSLLMYKMFYHSA